MLARDDVLQEATASDSVTDTSSSSHNAGWAKPDRRRRQGDERRGEAARAASKGMREGRGHLDNGCVYRRSLGFAELRLQVPCSEAVGQPEATNQTEPEIHGRLF